MHADLAPCCGLWPAPQQMTRSRPLIRVARMSGCLALQEASRVSKRDGAQCAGTHAHGSRQGEQGLHLRDIVSFLVPTSCNTSWVFNKDSASRVSCR